MEKKSKNNNRFRVFDMIRVMREHNKKYLEYVKSENTTKERVGKYIKARQLAELLGFKHKQSINDYIMSAEKLGYKIESKGGYTGGYMLIEERLNENEIATIIKEITDADLIEKIIRINNRI